MGSKMAKSAKSTTMPLFTMIATISVIATWALVALHGVK
jgi:hypothetical protein